jgi:xylulokinase
VSLSGDLFLGLDLGTSSLKALAMDASCAVVAAASAAYPLYSPAPGYAEQDPRDWLAALRIALARLWANGIDAHRVAAVGLAGQMHGLVLLDRHGEALGRCQTWADSRCETEARGMERRLARGRFAAITGSRANASATAAKLLWVNRHEPERRARAAHVLLPKDYLRQFLTGEIVTDVTDASGTLLCDVEAREWSDEVLDTLRISRALLPPAVESPTVTGNVTRAAAQALGLPAGIPVVAGAGDAESAAIGMGLAGEPDDLGAGLATLGTAAQVFAVTTAPRQLTAAGLQTLCHAVPGRWHVMGALLTGASALDWLAGAQSTPYEQTGAIARLLDEAAAEPPGAHGLLFLPHLRGTRMPTPDPTPQGAFVGLRPEHGYAALARATAEGVALALAEAVRTVQAEGIEMQEVRLAGGAQRHPLWARLLADSFGLRVRPGATEDASALGAALLGALGVGALPTTADMARLAAPTNLQITPDPAATAFYSQLGTLARDATQRLRPTFRALRRQA